MRRAVLQVRYDDAMVARPVVDIGILCTYLYTCWLVHRRYLPDRPRLARSGLWCDSAHWCPPCRGFTPKLAELYKQLTEAGKSFEIVFVSSDKSEDQFNEYFDEMPWLTLPFALREAKQKLSQKYKYLL